MPFSLRRSSSITGLIVSPTAGMATSESMVGISLALKSLTSATILALGVSGQLVHHDAHGV